MRRTQSLFGLVVLSLGSSVAHAQDAQVAPSAEVTPSIALTAQTGATTTLDDQLGVPGGLRAEDVARAVVDTSHDRRARLAELAAARTEIDRATFGYVPRVGVTIGYSRLSEISQPSLGVLAAPLDQSLRGPLPAGTQLMAIPLQFPVILDQTQLRAQVAIPITDYFLRVMPAQDAGEHSADAAEAMIEVTERRLALEAETLYWSWARASLGIIVAQQALAAAEAHREDTTRLVRAGVALDVDLARAEAQVAAMQELVGVAEHARDAASDRIRTIMHADRIATTVGDRLDVATASADLEADVSRALENRAELRALDAQLAASDAQHAILLAGMLPRVDVVGEVLLANPNPRYVPQTERFDFTWQVGAQASWQLADTLSGEASQRALDARMETLRESREVAREGIRAEVVDAHRALADAALSTTTRAAQVSAAERAVEQASAVYRVGRGNGLVVIDAQTLLVRARLDLLAARIDARIADARRRRAISE